MKIEPELQCRPKNKSSAKKLCCTNLNLKYLRSVINRTLHINNRSFICKAAMH